MAVLERTTAILVRPHTFKLRSTGSMRSRRNDFLMTQLNLLVHGTGSLWPKIPDAPRLVKLRDDRTLHGLLLNRRLLQLWLRYRILFRVAPSAFRPFIIEFNKLVVNLVISFI